MTKKQYKMLLDWMRKIHQLEYAHRFQSIFFSLVDKSVSISLLFITSLMAICETFPAKDPKSYSELCFILKYENFIPISSAITVLLTSLLTFLRPSEKTEIHQKTGSSYEKLRHSIEVLLTSDFKKRKVEKKICAIKNSWDNLDAINTSPYFFKKGKKKVKSLNTYPKELSFIKNMKHPHC